MWYVICNVLYITHFYRLYVIWTVLLASNVVGDMSHIYETWLIYKGHDSYIRDMTDTNVVWTMLLASNVEGVRYMFSLICSLYLLYITPYITNLYHHLYYRHITPLSSGLSGAAGNARRSTNRLIFYFLFHFILFDVTCNMKCTREHKILKRQLSIKCTVWIDYCADFWEFRELTLTFENFMRWP